jgi:hypothetical protein
MYMRQTLLIAVLMVNTHQANCNTLPKCAMQIRKLLHRQTQLRLAISMRCGVSHKTAEQHSAHSTPQMQQKAVGPTLQPCPTDAFALTGAYSVSLK